jgi:regulator of replication initiation timing
VEVGFVSNDDFAPTVPKNRKRLLERLDDMVQSGQVTAEEAADLRSATRATDYEAAALRIRIRHARARLEAAVEAGQMTPAEASANMECIRKGEHPRSLRAHLRKIAPTDTPHL